MLLILDDIPCTRELDAYCEMLSKRIIEEFSDAMVKVDENMHNRSRVVKVYGSVARAGQDTHERPHRLSRILDVPVPRVPITLAMLEQSLGKPEIDEHAPHQLDGEVCPDHVADIKSMYAVKGWAYAPDFHYQLQHGGRGYHVRSPCLARIETEDLRNPSQWAAYFLQFPDGTRVYRCSHNGCADKRYRDAQKLEPSF